MGKTKENLHKAVMGYRRIGKQLGEKTAVGVIRKLKMTTSWRVKDHEKGEESYQTYMGGPTHWPEESRDHSQLNGYH